MCLETLRAVVLNPGDLGLSGDIFGCLTGRRGCAGVWWVEAGML